MPHYPLPLLELLNRAEDYLKQHALWDEQEPNEEALASQAPFALDTLEPEQWLQWIFIPKMKQMLGKEQLPAGFAISPYFEEVWKEGNHQKLLEILRAIDEECR